MLEDESGEITILLKAVKNGSPGATDRLMSLVYDRLRGLARNRVRSTGVSDLDPTTLVHEAYLKMFGTAEPSWENRHHFFWAAARAMRDILIDRARKQATQKRGGGRGRAFFEREISTFSEADDLLALDEAIHELERAHPDVARIVFLRFFAGLTREQTAEISGMSEAAVFRTWAFAKAWLLDALDSSDSPTPPGSSQQT